MPDDLIKRAKEYLTDKYLDLADVPKFIERLVQLHEANERLRARVAELEVGASFDLSDEFEESYGFNALCDVCGKPRNNHLHRHPLKEQSFGRES